MKKEKTYKKNKIQTDEVKVVLNQGDYSIKDIPFNPACIVNQLIYKQLYPNSPNITVLADRPGNPSPCLNDNPSSIVLCIPSPHMRQNHMYVVGKLMSV